VNSAGVAVSLLLIGTLGGWIALLWFASSWIRKRWARILACTVVALPTWVVICVPIVAWVLRPMEEGRWCCVVCGATEQRLVYGSWILWTGASRDLEAARDGERFEEWFHRTIRAPHEHDWIHAGCHYHPATAMVGCALDYGQTYFRTLPTLPDQEVAAWMLNRMLRASPSRRSDLIRHLGRCETEDLFQQLADGTRMSREEFDEAFARWRQDHPEWR
jgi:hypothetical protein